MTPFQPVLLGSDMNAYGMARAFHEAYGITSTAFAHFQLSPTKYSRIIDVHIHEHFDQLATFISVLTQYAEEQHARNPELKLVLIPCGDVYANLLSWSEGALKEHYVYNTLSKELNHQLSYKNEFYQLLERHGMPHPQTVVVTKEDVARKAYRELPFAYPIVMKPADSAAWLDVHFEGRKKAFIIETPEELDTLIQRSYQAGYQAQMVLQDFIPGGDEQMRVMNVYVDQHHQVRLMAGGRPILEDPTPEAVGNYAAILPQPMQDMYDTLRDFLTSIKYCGVANFDFKLDSRDGRYKLFEINLRQGRSSFYVTLGGNNLATYFVRDLVLDEPQERIDYAHSDQLWLEVPPSFIKRYVTSGDAKDTALAMLREGHWGTTLEYAKDMSLLRRVMLWRMFSIYKRRYAQYFLKKADLK